jgi:hypothetical protein
MHGSAPGGPEYFIEAANKGGSSLDVTTETNVLSSTPTFTNSSVSVPKYSSGGSAPQGVAAFDDRIFNVAFRTVNGVNHLVAAHQVAGGNGKNSAPVARWYDIDTTTMTTIQSGNAPAGASGAATFMPSVDINAAGSIGMTFGESASSEFWSMYVAERTASDPAGTMESPVLVQAGTRTSPDSRVGDYSGTTVDPSDGLTFWSGNEYQGADFWDTHIASFSIAGAVHSPAIRIGLPPSAASGQTASLVGDPNMPNQVAIASFGTLVASTRTDGGFPSAAAVSGNGTVGAVRPGPDSVIDQVFAASVQVDFRLAASSGTQGFSDDLLDGTDLKGL